MTNKTNWRIGKGYDSNYLENMDESHPLRVLPVPLWQKTLAFIIIVPFGILLVPFALILGWWASRHNN